MTMPMYVPPEQLIKDRAEFAKKGIARGRPIVVIEYADGVLLLGENPSGSLQNMRVAAAGPMEILSPSISKVAVN